MLHLTFDLEIYDAIKNWDEIRKKQFFEKQEEILIKIFKYINESNIKITCFITNEFIDYHNDFFHKYIVSNHETACHTADHLFYNGTNLEEFVNNICKNKSVLEKETGKKCLGFRAPSGQVPNTLISILKKLSFKYDSSVIPGILPGRFNNSNAPKKPYFPNYNNIFVPDSTNTDIIEFPLLTSKILKISMNGILFSFYYPFVKVHYFTQPSCVLYLHPSDFLKFNIIDRTFFWDKTKFTKFYWAFIQQYINHYHGKDLRLITLYKKINKLHEV
jgi:hypothetical protein